MGASSKVNVKVVLVIGVTPTNPVVIAKPSPEEAACCFIAYKPGVPVEVLISDAIGSLTRTCITSPNQFFTFVSLGSKS